MARAAGSGIDERPRARRLVLASGSPRRRQLLESIGLRFAAIAPDIDETPRPRRGARALRASGWPGRRRRPSRLAPDDVVLAADTTVAFAGADPRQAGRRRRRPSHAAGSCRTRPTTCTPASPCGPPAGPSRGSSTTDVTMVRSRRPTSRWYVGTGEPLDKAGAYALQGAGGVLVRVRRGQRSATSSACRWPSVAELLAAAGWPLDRLRHQPPG